MGVPVRGALEVFGDIGEGFRVDVERELLLGEEGFWCHGFVADQIGCRH